MLGQAHRARHGARDLRLERKDRHAFVPPQAGQVALDVIDGKGISDQLYSVENGEWLVTPAGEFDTVKLVRRKENNERAELWLARERDFLPVRLLIVGKDGTRLDQVATRISSP
ncbi:MAG: DUF3108 domain-containing protein [Betaproteobacteria bacterium]|nr:MAG: DUF3108 domain-containing protein [Betaproteobacteria bacterium]